MKAGDREKVGPHGLEVTRLGLGGTAFANMYAAITEEESREVLAAAYAAGVRYFDTAPLYGYGMSETRMARGSSYSTATRLRFPPRSAMCSRSGEKAMTISIYSSTRPRRRLISTIRAMRCCARSRRA